MSSDHRDLVPLSERVVYLQALRVAFVAATLAAALLAPAVVGAEVADLLLATAAYIAIAACAELVAQFVRGRALPVLGAMLLVDGLYLGWVMYATGGTASPLRFLVYVHLIAVTLIASYRTGLKIALWHSLLFFVTFYAQAADILAPTDAAMGLIPGSPEFNRMSIFNVSAFWLVALGTAAFSALNERELRRRKSDLEDLSGMSARLKQEAEPDTVADIMLGALMDSFGYKRGFVVAKPDDPQVIAYRGPGEIQDPPPGSNALLERAWRVEQTLLVKKPDEESDPGIVALLPFARNLVIVPMFADGHEIGAVVLEAPARAATQIERRVVAMTEQFVAHGALALRNALLLQEVRTMADTDSLTSLANRRNFQRALEREVARCDRTGGAVSLVLLDVDHFKRFNDTHGHQAGDNVLRKVGEVLTEECRDFDIPARYGGEEFAVILPNCASRESLTVGERLRLALRQIEAEDPVTASAGVATYPTNASTIDELIRAADEALYSSKSGGRDRITRSTRMPGRSSGHGAA